MCNDYKLTPAQEVLASQLGQIRPIRETFNHDLLLFQVGQSSTGIRRPWQVLSGVLAVLLICSVLGQVTQKDPHEPIASSYVVGHPAAQNTYTSTVQRVERESAGSYVYLTLREGVIEQGMDALPAQSGTRGRVLPKNRKEWMEGIL
jgi:hypothetical protein